MADGKELGIDLGYLWDCGHAHLPSMAEQYGRAAAIVHATGAMDSQLFLRPGTGGESSPVLAVWQALRDRLQTVSADTCVNLRDTGAALVRIAYEYHAEDVVAHNEMKDHVESVDLDARTPDSVPDPPRPGDAYSPAPEPEVGF